jgi:hypothetical protein
MVEEVHSAALLPQALQEVVVTLFAVTEVV